MSDIYDFTNEANYAPFTFTCEGCGLRTRVLWAILQEMRAERIQAGECVPDEILVSDLEWCGACAEGHGVEYPLEHVNLDSCKHCWKPEEDRTKYDAQWEAYNAACDERSYGDPYRDEDEPTNPNA